MIIKLLISHDNKLIINKFHIQYNKSNNKIVITSLNNLENYIKVPIYNKYNGIDYYSICFPLELIVINNNVLNPYLILSSSSMNNSIDFFYNLHTIINNVYNLHVLNFNELYKSFNFIKVINDNYIQNIEMNDLKNSDLNIVIKKVWTNLNIIKLCIIYFLIKFPDISNKNYKIINNKNDINKKIYTYANLLKSYRYNLFTNQSEHNLVFSEYYNFNYNVSIKLIDLVPKSYYFIIANNDESIINKNKNIDITNKIIKVQIKKITKNIIILDNDKNIIYEKYNWYAYYPNIKIDKNSVIYHTFLNEDFTSYILTKILNIEDIASKKIVSYYIKDPKISNLLPFNIYIPLSDFDILKSNSYTDSFFEYITKKYSDITVNNNIFEILGILFANYNYPLKTQRHDLEPLFDHIMYFSLYNYKVILLENNKTSFYNNDMLHPNVNNIIPIKLKNLYINLLKSCSQMINNNFSTITFNQKFYNDQLHRNIIKIIFSDSNRLFINLFKNLLVKSTYEKFKNIIITNILLIDLSSKITWSNLAKKLNYLNYFYTNSNILFFQDKINKNIISDTFDTRIKKIIENPIEMYKYLRKEKDFIRWSKFISEKLIQLYYIPISLSSDDFIHIGKLIFLLFNIIEQDLKDKTYVAFIENCNRYNKLILDNSRINLKIKENFPNLKINLGFVAKHLTWNKEIITFDKNKEEIKTEQVIILENKLQDMTKKYYKYKLKYLESCKSDVNTNKPKQITTLLTKYYNNISSISETSISSNKKKETL